MADWVETPGGRYVNLDLVFVADEEDDGSLRLYADDTPRVYSGGKSFFDADAVYLRDELHMRSIFRASIMKENLSLVNLESTEE